MLTEAVLPEPMRALARRNAHEISARRWDFDFDSLAKPWHRRWVSPTRADAPEAVRLRADIDFQSCLQTMEGPMLDETLQRARNTTRGIKSG